MEQIVIKDSRTSVLAFPVPEMTEDQKRYWEQPPQHRLTFTDTTVTMSHKDFEMLKNYSASMPSGVYPGKMWRWSKRESARRLDVPDEHHLLWYGAEFVDPTTNVPCVHTHSRLIIIEG